MGLEKVLEKLSKDESIKGIFVLDGEFYKEVIEEEGSVIESSMGMPLVNRALEEVLKRKVAVCVFCDGAFDIPMNHIMVMEDGCGNRIGHDVPACMADDFKDDLNILWLCDDFAMYPDRAETQEIVMVMLPQKAHSVGEKEGVKEAIILYPATSTDILLRKRFGISLNDPKMARMASAILAFDII